MSSITIKRVFAYALLCGVGISAGCTIEDERTPNEGKPTGGASTSGAGPNDAGNATTGGGPIGGDASDSGSNSGGSNNAGGGQGPTAGQTSTDGGGSAGEAAGGAGGAPQAVDEGILSEYALWRIPSSPGSSLLYPFNYDADDADVTVDQVTGLYWQKHPSATAVTWQGAMDACEALELGGQSDWRLPTRMEWLSIVDYAKQNPALDTTAFPDTKLDYYWTSSPSDIAGFRWQVGSAKGVLYREDITGKYYARCVRGRTVAPATHYTVGTGVVIDNYTRLMWEMPRPTTKLNYADSQARCSGLEINGLGNWRLATITELQSLVDVTVAAGTPAIDTTVFTDDVSDMDWSQTVVATAATQHWLLQWEQAVTPMETNDGKRQGRCVRFNL